MSWIDRRGVLRMGAGAPLALTGCATLLGAGNGSAPTVYRLTPKPIFPSKISRVDWVLIVAEPAAEGTLDSDQIAVLAQGRVSRLAGVIWSDRATAMLQFVIVQAFQSSSRLPAVGTDRDDLPGRYLLQSTLNAFQLEPDGDGYAAHVDLRVLLLRLPGREIAGAHGFSRRVGTPEASNAAAVAAFNAAVGGVLEDLVAWTLTTGRR